ncbi:MAG: MFS transporter [Trueperaceae bacterium]|nr:MFS transporter [Trueperaceae bacterium]
MSKPGDSLFSSSAVALYVTGLIAFIGLYLPQPVLPLISDYFGVATGRSSLVISLTILGIGLAAPFIGILSDRFGRKTIILLAAFLLSLISLGAALSQHFGTLLLLRFAQGLALPGLFVIALTYTSEQSSKTQMAGIAGLYVASTVVGGIIGRLLEGFITDLYSWRQGFAASSVLYLLLVVLWSREKGKEFSSSSSLLKALSGTLKHLGNTTLAAGLALGFCLFFAFQTCFTYLPFKLSAAPFSLSASLISLVYLSFIAGILSSSLAGKIRQRYGLRNGFALGFVAALLGNVISLSSSLPLVFLGLLFICFGNWLVQGLAVGFITTAVDSDRAGANALYQLAYYLGGSLGAYLPGLIYDRFAFAGAISMGLLALTVGLSISLTRIKLR